MTYTLATLLKIANGEIQVSDSDPCPWASPVTLHCQIDKDETAEKLPTWTKQQLLDLLKPQANEDNT